MNKEHNNLSKDNNSPNKATYDAGLMFNVINFRKWMKLQFDINDDKIPIFAGGHIALTACIEEMIRLIINSSLDYLPKDNAGLYELTKSSILNGILMNNNLKYIFIQYINSYDEHENYTSNYPVKKQILINFIDKYFSKNIKLSNEGYNILSFLLTKFAVNITKNSKYLIYYAGKKSINYKTIMFAIKMFCPEFIINTLIRQIEDSCVISKDEELDDEDEKEELNNKKVILNNDNEKNLNKNNLNNNKDLDEEDLDEEDLDEGDLDEEDLEEDEKLENNKKKKLEKNN